MSSNPFETPQTELPRSAFGRGPGGLSTPGQWREGDILHHPRGAEFADRCVKCNAPAHGYRLRRKLYWHSPWYYLFLIQIWIYVVVALIVRKTMAVEIGLCAQHRSQRRNAMIAGSAITLASMGGCIGLAGEGAASGGFILAVMLGVLAGLVTLILGERVLVAVRIDKEEARIKGVCDAYLNELPSGPD